MSTTRVDLDDDLTALLHESNQPVQVVVREFLVLELYRRGTISSGKAAQLLGMSRWEFIRHASRLGIALFDMTEEEWQAERSRSMGEETHEEETSGDPEDLIAPQAAAASVAGAQPGGNFVRGTARA